MLARKKIPDRVLDRVRPGSLSFEYPHPDRWNAVSDPSRFDRSVEERGIAPLVLRFEGLADDSRRDDLDRLRLEFESMLLRVPALRARPLARIEICLDSPWLGDELAALIREVRRPFRPSTETPVVFQLSLEPSLRDLEGVREAGCTHLHYRDLQAERLAPLVPELRRIGFAAIAADLRTDELGHSDGALLSPDGLDAIVLCALGGDGRSDGRSSHDLLSQRIGAGLVASASLRQSGFVSPVPRRFSRGTAFPGLDPLDDAMIRLGFGPGAIRRAGVHSSRNTTDRARWAHAIDHGQVPVGTDSRPDPEEILRGKLIRSLLGRGRVEVVEIEREFRLDFIHHFQIELGEIEERQYDGLVEFDQDRIEATTLGQLLIEDVAGCFDPQRRGTPR